MKKRKKYEKTLRKIYFGAGHGLIKLEKFKKDSKKKHRLSPKKYCKIYKIDSRVKLAKTYLKNKRINFKSPNDLIDLLAHMEMEPHDIFKYICEGILKSNKRKIKHIFEDEPWTEDNPQTELVEFFNQKVKENERKGLPIYTIKQLYKDKYTNQWFDKYMKIHGVRFRSYSQFYKFFIDWKHIYETLND